MVGQMKPWTKQKSKTVYCNTISQDQCNIHSPCGCKDNLEQSSFLSLKEANFMSNFKHKNKCIGNNKERRRIGRNWKNSKTGHKIADSLLQIPV